jgi:Ohr subfamily peroxiredoxin
VKVATTLYTTTATVIGGRASGRGFTDDGVLDVQLGLPAEMGGPGTGTNPEQLFAIGYAACFEGALGVVCRRNRTRAGQVSIESLVRLIAIEGDAWSIAVELRVTLPQVTDPEQAVRLVAAAHELCAYSNATRGNIGLTLLANGRDVLAPRASPGSSRS